MSSGSISFKNMRWTFGIEYGIGIFKNMKWTIRSMGSTSIQKHEKKQIVLKKESRSSRKHEMLILIKGTENERGCLLPTQLNKIEHLVTD